MGSKRQLLIVLDSAASRFTAIKRGLAYSSFFASHPEWSVEYVDRNPPLSPPRQLSRFQRLTRRVAKRLARYSQPIRQVPSGDEDIVNRARCCDLVYLVKTPAPDLLKQIVELNGPRVIFDITDVLWLPYHRNGYGKGFERFEEMLSAAHSVTCENHYLADYVRKYNPSVRVVPDCTQLDAFESHRGKIVRDRSKVRLGWIGSQVRAGDLYAIWEPLEELFARHPHLELRILGAAEEHLPHFEKVRWSSLLEYDKEQMVREAMAMDIGLFPLFRVEEALGRGNGKALIYMAGEAVAVCENIGENARLIQDRVNGVLASGHEEWLAKLDWLVSHPEERRRIGRTGLETVQRQFTDRSCFEQLVDALNFFASANIG